MALVTTLQTIEPAPFWGSALFYLSAGDDFPAAENRVQHSYWQHRRGSAQQVGAFLTGVLLAQDGFADPECTPAKPLYPKRRYYSIITWKYVPT